MKKLIALILALLMLTSLLCACNKTDKPDEPDKPNTDNTEPPDDNKEPEAPVKFQRGETTATAYINQSLGITFNLPQGWRFYTDSEIASMLNITVDMFKDKEIFSSTNFPSLIDFMAVDDATGNNVNMSIDNLKATNNINITVERYAQQFKNLLAQQVPGAKYSFGEDTTVKLAGKEYLKLTATCEYSNIKMYQFVYIIKVDTYIVAFSATSVNGGTAATFEAMFS